MYQQHNNGPLPKPQPARKGFEAVPESWYTDDFKSRFFRLIYCEMARLTVGTIVNNVQRAELFQYLSTMSKELRKNDPVRWQEHGIVPDVARPDQVQFARHRLVDIASGWSS